MKVYLKIFSYITKLTWANWINIISIIVNILMIKYNIKKNRIIYDVEELTINSGEDKEAFKKLRDKLNTAKYTILTTYRSPFDRYQERKVYVLGKISK